MIKADINTNIVTDEQLSKGTWCPIIEIYDTCETDRAGFIYFELSQIGGAGFYTSEYVLTLTYDNSKQEHNVTVNLMWANDSTYPIECCYVNYPDNNKIIVYAKPSLSYRAIQLRIKNALRLGCFKLIPFGNSDITLSKAQINLPVRNINTNILVPPIKSLSSNSYKCFIGDKTGIYLIGKISCSNKYCNDTISLLIATSEGDSKEFAQAIVTIRYRKTDNTTFSHRISIIDGINSDNKLDSGITIGVTNIDADNLGIYLNFTKTYSGVTITALAFSSSSNGRFVYVEPEYVDNVTFAKSVSLDNKKVYTTDLELLNGWNTMYSSEYITQQVKNGVCIITAYNIHAGTVTDGTIIAKITSNLPSKNIGVSITSNVAGSTGTPRAILNPAGELAIRSVEDNAMVSFEIMYFI